MDNIEVKVGQVLRCRRKSFLPDPASNRRVYARITVGRDYTILSQHPEWKDVFYFKDDTGKVEGYAVSRFAQMFKLIKDV